MSIIITAVPTAAQSWVGLEYWPSAAGASPWAFGPGPPRELFGALMVFLDRPFSVGDDSLLDQEIEGTVEHIGWRLTRIAPSIKGPFTAQCHLHVPYGGKPSRMNNRRIYETIGVRARMLPYCRSSWRTFGPTRGARGHRPGAYPNEPTPSVPRPSTFIYTFTAPPCGPSTTPSRKPFSWTLAIIERHGAEIAFHPYASPG